jgi:hypothetical protein
MRPGVAVHNGPLPPALLAVRELFLFVGRLAAERARCDPETDAYSNANREPDTNGTVES